MVSLSGTLLVEIDPYSTAWPFSVLQRWYGEFTVGHFTSLRLMVRDSDHAHTSDSRYFAALRARCSAVQKLHPSVVSNIVSGWLLFGVWGCKICGLSKIVSYDPISQIWYGVYLNLYCNRQCTMVYKNQHPLPILYPQRMKQKQLIWWCITQFAAGNALQTICSRSIMWAFTYVSLFVPCSNNLWSSHAVHSNNNAKVRGWMPLRTIRIIKWPAY